MRKEKTVFVSGNFNVLHPGHLRLLRFANDCGERLIVGVLSDRVAGKAAYVPEQLRLEGVKSNSWVHDAFLIDKELTSVIGQLRPDIIVKGREHQNQINEELSCIEEYGGRLLFSSGDTTFSSLDILHREFTHSVLNDISIPYKFMERHDIENKKLKNLLTSFNSLSICVIGDLIVDEYITCEPLGMSQEDPTIVVTPLDSTKFIGGAGIVAAHASGLGAKVEFISVSGVDKISKYAVSELKKGKVGSHIIKDNSRPTTLKQRFRSKGKTLLRVNHLRQDAIDRTVQEQIYKVFESIVDDLDLLVFSDFNYGCLPQVLVDRLISLAQIKGIMITADSQSSSQVGDISRYKNVNLITPTEREARISTRNREDGLIVLAENLQNQSSAKHILLKLGEEGLLIYTKNNNINYKTDRLHALNNSARDVSGAGDSLLIAASLVLASGGSIWEASIIGSVAAAIQVGRMGNTPLQAIELENEFKD